MRTIFKYKLQVTGLQVIEIPGFLGCLSVGEQGGDLVLWAVVDTDQLTKPVKLKIQGTGNPMVMEPGEVWNFLGTVQAGSFVWHVFTTSPKV